SIKFTVYVVRGNMRIVTSSSNARLVYIWLTSSNYRTQIRAGIILMQRCRNVGKLRRYLHRKIYQKFNCEIHEFAKLDESIFFPHPLGIVIGESAQIGQNVTIFQNVTIGGNQHSHSMPKIGNNVHIFAGAKVLGDIEVGDDVIIGANSVVTKSVPAGHRVVGVNRILPAKEK
ncbi:MAG: serine O-acetyltransferase, partial [Enterovibrio sp.]